MKKLLAIGGVVGGAVSTAFAQAVAAPTPAAVAQTFTDKLFAEDGIVAIYGIGATLILIVFTWAFITGKFRRRQKC